ncbi:MAG: DNA protection protein DPS [Methanoregulaceae archaeon]|nr:DNA protection protein DPS [Methanoregulaceae archaeon]
MLQYRRAACKTHPFSSGPAPHLHRAVLIRCLHKNFYKWKCACFLVYEVKKMAKVSQEMVKKAGVNIDELIDLLVKNAGAELTTYYYYTILRFNLIDLEGEGVKEIAETARVEDRNHFEALVPRIYELGGKLPESMVDFHNLSACPPAKLPKNPKDVKAILKVLVEAERCAVRGYTHICNITAGKDHRTYDLALSILNEEIEHESWFSEFLGEGPSGHFLRRGETSPFVSKFLR